MKVTALTLRGGDNFDRLLESGASYQPIPHRSNYDPLISFRLRTLIRACHPSIVQTWLPQMDLLGGIATKSLDIPFVLSERTAPAAHGPGWKSASRRAIGRYASAIVANSEGGANYWRSPGRPDWVRVIPNAIEANEVCDAPPVQDIEVDRGKGSDLVLFMGRMHSVKNIPNVLAAFRRVIEIRPNVTAVLIGSGPELAAVVDAVRSYGLGDRLRVMPFQNNPYSWLKRASVFVSASTFEGNPNAVLEACAAGCPVVVSDIPAHHEFLDNSSATFVSGQSSESIFTGILEVLENPTKARSRATNAKQRISGRTVAAVTQHYLDIYELILRSPRRCL